MSAHEILRIAVSDLKLDLDNPRFVVGAKDQHDAIRTIFSVEAEHQMALVDDIVAKQAISPADLPIVVRDGDKFLVLDGNRRTAALKALLSPELVNDELPRPFRERLDRAAASFESFDSINCCLFNERDIADQWVRQRHLGEQDGAGLRRWKGLAKARDTKRMTGHTPRALQVLEFIEDELRFDMKQLGADFSYSTFERIIHNSQARLYLGIDFEQDGGGWKMECLGKKTPIAKSVEAVVQDIASGRSVRDINTTNEMLTYLHELDNGTPPPTEMNSKYNREVLPKIADALGIDVSGLEPADEPFEEPGAETNDGGVESIAPKPQPKKQAPKRPQHSRPVKPHRLMSEDFSLPITHVRIYDIFDELRAITLRKYPNAASALMRVFIELSLNELQAACRVYPRGKPDPSKSLQKWDEKKLRQKLEVARAWAEDAGALERGQILAINRVISGNRSNVTDGSIQMLNAFMHSKHVTPEEDQLQKDWQRLEPFLDYIWQSIDEAKKNENDAE